MTTGHGEPIQKQFAFEDQEHIVGVDLPRPALPARPEQASPVRPPNGPATARQRGGRAAEVNGHANGDGHAAANGDGHGHNPALPPPPYGIALTAGGKVLRFSLASLAAVSTRKGRIVVRLDPGVKDDLVVGVAGDRRHRRMSAWRHERHEC